MRKVGPEITTNTGPEIAGYLVMVRALSSSVRVSVGFLGGRARCGVHHFLASAPKIRDPYWTNDAAVVFAAPRPLWRCVLGSCCLKTKQCTDFEELFWCAADRCRMSRRRHTALGCPNSCQVFAVPGPGARLRLAAPA